MEPCEKVICEAIKQKRTVRFFFSSKNEWRYVLPIAYGKMTSGSISVRVLKIHEEDTPRWFEFHTYNVPTIKKAKLDEEVIDKVEIDYVELLKDFQDVYCWRPIK
jgi:hypothetical protein